MCSDFLAESIVIRKLEGSKLTFSKISARKVACEQQTYFRLSLLSLRKLTFGGREGTTGNTSAVHRLTEKKAPKNST